MVEVIKEHKQLFDTPAELICPITHTIMSDPVITPHGQIYDRAAIEQHLAASTVDPLTQTELGRNPTLTPVHSLKVRAQDYASNVATKCMEIAADFNCARPVVYMRRAAELCSEMHLNILGLSKEAAQYLLTHPDSCYDSMALEAVSRSMSAAGRPTTAGVMLYHAARLASNVDTTAGVTRMMSGGDGNSILGVKNGFLDRATSNTAAAWTRLLGNESKSGEEGGGGGGGGENSSDAKGTTRKEEANGGGNGNTSAAVLSLLTTNSNVDAPVGSGQRRALVQRCIEALLIDEPPIDLDLVYTLSKVVSLGEVTWGGLLACVERLPPQNSTIGGAGGGGGGGASSSARVSNSGAANASSSTSMHVRRATMHDLNERLQATGSLSMTSYVSANFQASTRNGPVSPVITVPPPPQAPPPAAAPSSAPATPQGPSSSRTAYAIRIAEHVLTNKHLVLPVESRFEVSVALLRLYMERVTSREKMTERTITGLKSSVLEMQSALGRSTTELENLTTNMQLLRNLVNQSFAQQGETSHILGETSQALGETTKTVLLLEAHLDSIETAVREVRGSVQRAAAASRARDDAREGTSQSNGSMHYHTVMERVDMLEEEKRRGGRGLWRWLRPLPVLALVPGMPAVVRTAALALPLLGQAVRELLPLRMELHKAKEEQVKEREVKVPPSPSPVTPSPMPTPATTPARRSIRSARDSIAGRESIARESIARASESSLFPSSSRA